MRSAGITAKVDGGGPKTMKQEQETSQKLPAERNITGKKCLQGDTNRDRLERQLPGDSGTKRKHTPVGCYVVQNGNKPGLDTDHYPIQRHQLGEGELALC